MDWVKRGGARVRRDPALLALVAAVAVSLAYLLLIPNAGTDLAAQVARAEATRQTGGSTWWGGWFGGVSMPTYSILSGQVMAVLGASLTGVVAYCACCWLAAGLLRDTHRPRAGALAAVVALAGNLAVGRVTFALGLVLALLALRFVHDLHHPAIAALTGAGAALLSPLAALFLCMACLGLVVADRRRRTLALCVSGAALTPVLVTAALFPTAGIQPVSANSIWLPMLGLALVALLPLPRVVRVTCAVASLSVGLAYVVPSPIGSNTQRIAVIACAPLIVALVRARPAALVLGLGAILAWPTNDIALSVQLSREPAAHADYYAPVRDMLPPGTPGGRLEVIETRGHWSSAYLADSVPLARGWERQTDRANNSFFYDGRLINATSYHEWLQENAVSWVALPDAEPDWAAQTEAKLVGAGLPYLQEVWRTDHWRFFRVVDAAPVAAAPATSTVLTQRSVTVTVAAPGTMRVRVRWSPQLALDGPAGCVAEDAGWTQLSVSLPGTYVLRGGFSPSKGVASDRVCTPGYPRS